MEKIEGLYYRFNLDEQGLLPTGWVESITNTCATDAKEVFLDGKDPTSREPKDAAGMMYRVVTGDIVATRLRWLHDLYYGPLLDLVNSLYGDRAFRGDDNLAFSININILSGRGDRYEWHVDTEPLSGVLFVTDHGEDTGGELVFQHQGRLVTVQPRRGDLVIFDARDVPHAVMPLKGDRPRISVPMGFFRVDQPTTTSDGLMSYLYASASDSGAAAGNG